MCRQAKIRKCHIAFADRIVVDEFKKQEIEVLVQAVGLMRGQNGFDMQPEEWDLMFQINAKGLFFMMQQVVSQSMTKTGGSIVNFSSMAYLLMVQI